MAENIRLITYAQQYVTPMNDAIMHDVEVGRSGILYGVTLSISENNIVVSGGYGVIKGRLFEITETQIPITLATDSNLRGRLYVEMDLSNTYDPILLKTEIGAEISDVVTDSDVNYTNGIYQLNIATFTVTTARITNLTRVVANIHGNGIESVTTANTSLNSYTSAGTYYFHQTYGATDAPYGTVGWLIVFDNAPQMNIRKQIWIFRGAASYVYARSFVSGAWTSWVRLVSEADAYYMPGDTATLYCYGGGFMTSAKTAIFYQLNLPKPISPSVSEIRLTGGEVTVRQGDKYLVADNSSISSFNPDVGKMGDNVIRIALKKASGFGGTNNDAVGVYSRAVIRFN